MNIHELRQEIANKTEELGKKIEARDLEGAKTLDSEIRQAKELLKIAEEKEEAEKRDLENQRNQKNKGKGENNMAVNEMRAIVKSLMGKELTTEERAVIKTADNSAVVPDQFINQLQEIKKGFGSLREYCDVIPVSKNSGTIPVVDLDQNTLPEVNEGDNIVDGTLVTTELPFECKKHGLIQSLSSELVDDAEIEIEELIKKNFAEIVTVCENTKIINILKTNASDVSGATGYEDIQVTIDSALPGYRNGLATYTNVKGFAYLKNLKDKDGKSLNLVTEVNGKYYFHNKELIVVDDSLLTPSTGTYIFIVANTKEAVKFVNRKNVTIARSTEAGFNDDTVKVRILTRFGVVKGTTRSIKKIEFTVTP